MSEKPKSMYERLLRSSEENPNANRLELEQAPYGKKAPSVNTQKNKDKQQTANTHSNRQADNSRPSLSFSDHTGHRQRLKERFDKVGIAGLQDYEVIEMFLFYVFRKGDTKPAAKRLIKEFGTLEKVFLAPPDLICSVPGINVSTARLMRFFRELSARIGSESLINNNVSLKHSRDLLKYLGSTIAKQPEESFRVLFLDGQNRIIKDELFSEGTENQTAIYPKKVLKRALDIRATGIIAVHNHPSGTMQPSSADVAITRRLANAADALDIRLVDHLIVGPSESIDGEIPHFSFRDNGLI